jgi:hypothetical protein
MHNALIFKEQTKIKESGLREKGLAQPHYSIHYIEGYDLLCYKEKIYIPQLLRKKTKSNVNKKDYQEYHDMAWSYTQDIEH